MTFEEYMRDKVDIVHNRNALYQIYQNIVDDLNATGKLNYEERKPFYEFIDNTLNKSFQEIVYSDDEGNMVKVNWMLGYHDCEVKEGEFSIEELFCTPHVEFRDWSQIDYIVCHSVIDGFEKMYKSYLEYNGICV